MKMKKNIMKIISSLITICILLLNVYKIPAYAIELSKKNISEDNAVSLVSDILMNNQIDIAKQKLSQNNIEILSFSIEENIDTNSEKSINPSDYSMITYSYRISGSNDIYLQTTIASDRSEWFSGPLDIASIEWDINYASYQTSKGDNRISTVRDATKRNNGLVIFNVEDSKLSKGENTVLYVRVRPIRGGQLHFGTEYAHTYKEFIINSPTISLGYKSGKIGLTFDLAISSGGRYWRKWNDTRIIVYP